MGAVEEVSGSSASSSKYIRENGDFHPTKKYIILVLIYCIFRKNTSRPERGDTEDTQNEEEIRGRYHQEYVDDGDLQEELLDGTDVCIYTASKRSRPWVGRVLKTYPEEGEFEVQWYEKDKSSKHGRYIAMTYPNDAPYVSRMPYSTVMVWSFTEQRGEFEFVISSYWQQYLKSEYEKLDA